MYFPGAVFLDSGLDLNSVWKMLRRILPEMDDIISLNPTNHVKQVMEHFPTKVKFSVSYFIF